MDIKTVATEITVFITNYFPTFYRYYSVFGKREAPQRFIIEDGSKPAIFGSYSYDPIQNKFLPPPREDDAQNQIVNASYILSTIVGDVDPANTTSSGLHNHSKLFFRKHVTLPTQNTTHWWARPKLPIPKPNNKTVQY